MYTSLTFLATAALASAATSYKASFTEYGSGDNNGSGNCNVATTACGYYTNVSLLPPKAHCNNRPNHRHFSPVTQQQFHKTSSVLDQVLEPVLHVVLATT